MPNSKLTFFLCTFVLLHFSHLVSSKKSEGDKKPEWAKKDILDFDEADMERLYDQWEEDDEPLPPDELPEHLRPPAAAPAFDMNNIGKLSPDEIMKLTKKGKTLMMFVNLDGNPTRQECDTLTGLWQTSLRNNHIQAERYVIDDARAIFLFQDGAQAWDAKDFFVGQEGVKDVTLEGQSHPGKYSKSKDTEKSAKKDRSGKSGSKEEL